MLRQEHILLLFRARHFVLCLQLSVNSRCDVNCVVCDAPRDVFTRAGMSLDGKGLARASVAIRLSCLSGDER